MNNINKKSKNVFGGLDIGIFLEIRSIRIIRKLKEMR
jgi:hypothetical protein